MVTRGWGVPGYTEVKTLGSGGFGDVVLARSASGTAVAIKYLHRTLLDDPGFVEMFRAEARVLASLDDPNVVRLYEYVESPSGAAIVMELVDGISLREILSQYGKTRAEAALVVLRGSLLGLAAAHARGVVHRDYKPANVLVDGHGTSKLTDFGIAARTGDRPVPAGTLAYAPPEQFEGTPASPAADVYAATVTFYECLTGQVPFTGSTDAELYNQHKSARVPMDPIPEPLRPIIARGLAKSPAYRPSDAARLAEELSAAASVYGRDWEERGRSHLGEAALLLAALWPTGTALLSGNGPTAAPGHAAPGHAVLPGHNVEQVHLSHDAQVTQQPQQAGHGNVTHGQTAHAQNATHPPAAHANDVHPGPHAEHLQHVEHLEHVQQAEHVEHLDHLKHLEHEQAGHGATGHGSVGQATTRARRTVRTARRAAAHHPVAAVAAAVVAVAAVAGIAVAASGGSGGPSLSVAGSWTDGGAGVTFTFTPSGADKYAVSLENTDVPQCNSANDGSVTGSNGHYTGTVDLYSQDYTSADGKCDPKSGVSQIILVVAANGKTMNADLTSGDCSECGDSTWTRKS